MSNYSNYEMNTQYQQPQGYEPQFAQQSGPQHYQQCQECAHAHTQPQFQAQPAPQNYEGSYPQQGQYEPAANASYYSGAPMDGPGSDAENEKGLGSTVIGGAAGGYAGHKMGGGKLATVAGAAVGAVGMNMATHAMKPKPSVAAPVAQPALMNPMCAHHCGHGLADASLLGGGIPMRGHGLLGRRAMRRGRLGMMY